MRGEWTLRVYSLASLPVSSAFGMWALKCGLSASCSSWLFDCPLACHSVIMDFHHSGTGNKNELFLLQGLLVMLFYHSDKSN